ncbi:HDOD domain-containing protein [Rhodanobacter lindaniclasticus]
MVGSMWRRVFPRRKAKVSAQRATAVRSPASAPTVAAAPAVSHVATDAPSLAQIDERFHRLVLGLPPTAHDEPLPAEQAMLRRLELLSARFDLRSLPRLPTVLPQLLRTLKSDEAAGAELAKLVGRDPLMVGEVMRATSTVVYRSAQPIGSLQQAVVLLGQDGLRRVITQHVMKPILQGNTGSMGHAAGGRLWSHAERCAHACAWLGRTTGCDAFEAYLAGIVRHAGTGAVVRLLDQLMPGQTPPPLSGDFVRHCARLAAQLSLQAARQWELPPRVLDAMAECQGEVGVSTSPLGRALAVADSLASLSLLVEHGEFAADTELAHSWPGVMPPAVLTRCQRDLGQHFKE